MARNRLAARAKVVGWYSSPRVFTKVRPELLASFYLQFVHFSKELQWFSCGHVLSTSESAYKNKGFVNFIVESLAINASRLTKY